MNRPWMPLYVADYVADTSHLNATESGAYLHLIMHYWLNHGLPDDDRKLARIARMSDRQWAAAKPTIVEFFHDGWQHKRIDAELARATDISSKRRASAQQKHSKSSAIAPAKAQQLHTHARASSQSQSHIPEANASGPPTQAELERELFRRGKQVCGNASGGLINSLLKAKEHDVALARSVVEMASTKNDPREFVAAATRSNGNGARNPTMAAFDDLISRAEGAEVEGDSDFVDVTTGRAESR